MNAHVLAIAEQFWHRVPGGTAMATEKTLGALTEIKELRITAIAARHRGSALEEPSVRSRIPSSVELHMSRLPRAAMYEGWLRLGSPSVNRHCGPLGSSVVWASSLVVPPTDRPVVATVHDLEFLRRPEFLSKRGKKFFPLMWQKAKERAELFVCPSNETANDCLAHGISAERVVVVPWGAEAPQCTYEEAKKMGEDLSLPEQFVLWVGAPDRRKNPQLAAAAIEAIGCEVVVVGAPSIHAEGEAAFAALADQVTRLPPINDYMLSALYQLADVLLYPSLAEGFGLPILEAMVHGTPVVTSALTATEEVAGGAALIVDPNDGDAIADALRLALNDSATRKQLIESGLARAGELTWDATAKGYAEAFHSVL